MQSDSRIYSLPRWRVTRWLADCGADVPEDIRIALIGNVYGTLPVFIGGILNTLLVAAVIAARSPTPLFIAWLAIEIAICLTRLTVLIVARRRALRHHAMPTDINLVLSIAWSGSVGYGALISLATGDWVAATLACISAGAMVGGICFRNFSAPRLCGAMIVLSLGPTIPGALIAGEPLMLVLFFQIPMYLAAMTMACFKLNHMLIATMRAERENDHRARHDELTGLANRAGLVGALEERLSPRSGRGETLALLYLDLDDFKVVNDTHGHAAGDRLLQSVAERLRGVLREGDLPARLGGDEFVVLGARCTEEQATALGRHLVEAIGVPHDLDCGAPARVSVSVGIAMAPKHGNGAADLLRAADAALYQAKFAGGSRCEVASEDDLARLRLLLARSAAEPVRQSAAA
ncbi:GGDEF domain-containing protein [Bradyrhizobium sp. INPA01-394B]|uniref:GGDEF domain-containing protein n=2 Tax=Bradyrhizobium campsiandrae TaxID=1729892 RepID=A0ABR7U5Z8_9BRAD|nr:GGDEF domain-containing protein [Bradyrhizobium campsiandrae]MBC9978966.1 GGDEF domain-containing protein [Bradyrhizobium campsiandrae]